jgi:hypothetical protein
MSLRMRSGNPGVVGACLLATGAAAYLGLRTLFLDHWIAVVMFGASGWIAAAGYAAICIALVGAGLILFAIFRRRPAL